MLNLDMRLCAIGSGLSLRFAWSETLPLKWQGQWRGWVLGAQHVLIETGLLREFASVRAPPCVSCFGNARFSPDSSSLALRALRVLFISR